MSESATCKMRHCVMMHRMREEQLKAILFSLCLTAWVSLS